MSDDPSPKHQPSSADREFQSFLHAKEFRIQRCNDCNEAVFFPRVICPHCGSLNLDWIEPSGFGTVYSTTTVRHRKGTHNVCLIDLDEGPRLMSRIIGMPSEEVTIGMRVSAVIAEIDGAPLLVFEGGGA